MGWIDTECFGYPVKFVRVKEKVKYSVFLTRYYVYLNEKFIGIIEHHPPGSIFWSITPSGPIVYRSVSMISCVRDYVLNNLL